MQFFVALAIDERAETLVDFGYGGFDLRTAMPFAIALGHDAENDRRPAGVDANARNAAAADEIGHERLHLAFAGAETLDVPPQNDAAAGPHAAQGGKQMTLPHLPHFRRNARQGNESATPLTRKRVRRPQNVEIDTRRGAVHIRHDAAARGEVGLQLIALGHFPLSPGKELPDVLEGLRNHDQGAIGRCGQGLARKVVGRGAQPAGGNDKVGPLDRAAEDVDARRQLVADGRVIHDANTQLTQSLAEPL